MSDHVHLTTEEETARLDALEHEIRILAGEIDEPEDEDDGLADLA